MEIDFASQEAFISSHKCLIDKSMKTFQNDEV